MRLIDSSRARGHRGWVSKLFGAAPRPAVTTTPSKALCLRMAGAYIIDLGGLPEDRARIKNAIGEVAGQVAAVPEPHQVWVIPEWLLELRAGRWIGRCGFHT